MAQKPFATVELFGEMDGKLVHKIGLRSGLVPGQLAGANIITRGATIQELKVPDKNGQLADVVLGFDTLEGYNGRNPCIAATPGRYANRIAEGKFELEGVKHTVTANWKGKSGTDHMLHGGVKGRFDNLVWDIVRGPWVDKQGAAVTLGLTSPAGTDGFPGALTAKVTYTWTVQQTLEIEWHATTDATTVVNLTNHTYWNLAGVESGRDCQDHAVQIAASKITAVNEDAIPSGETPEVSGTVFDFQEAKKLGEKIEEAKSQAAAGGIACGSPVINGFDHNYCVDAYDGNGTMQFVAKVSHSESGRCMDVWSTQPGVQFFTGNDDCLEGIVGKGGVTYPNHAGLALETQHYPDSPNHASFPSTTLTKDGVYSQSCSYRFSA